MNNFDAGFSFCGYHSDRDMDVAIGNFDEAMNAIAPDFSALSETVDGYDGGYFTGTKEGPLAIPLQIIVDEAPRSKLNKIGWWMRRGAVGQLIFDNMPYKYYMARVTSQATPPMYMHFSQTLNAFVYSGVINVTLTAYTPRAYLLDEVLAQYPDIGSAYDGVNDATGIVEPSVRPAKILTNLTGTINTTLFNQGTAPAKAAITVAGTMEAGVTVSNLTTGQSFTLTAPDGEAHAYSVDAQRGYVAELSGTLELEASESQFANKTIAQTLENGQRYVLSVGSVVQTEGTPPDYLTLNGFCRTDNTDFRAANVQITTEHQSYAFTVPDDGREYSLILYHGVGGSAVAGNAFVLTEVTLTKTDDTGFIPARRTIASNVKTGHFIELAPCMPFLRDVPCTVAGSTVTFDTLQPMNANNTYILANNTWYPVTTVSGNVATVDGTPDAVAMVCVAQMNRIEITVPSGSSIALVQFDYRDTFY